MAESLCYILCLQGTGVCFFLGCKHLHCSVFVAISGKVELWPPITTNMCSIYLLDLNLQFFLGPTAKSHKYIVDPASEVPLTVFSGGNNTSLLLNSEQHCHPHVSSACLQAIWLPALVVLLLTKVISVPTVMHFPTWKVNLKYITNVSVLKSTLWWLRIVCRCINAVGNMHIEKVRLAV